MKRVLNDRTGEFKPFYPKRAQTVIPEVQELREQNAALMKRLEALEKKEEKAPVENTVEEVVDEVVDFSMSMTKDQLEETAAMMGILIPKNAKKKDIYDLIVQKKEEDALEAQDDSEEDDI